MGAFDKMLGKLAGGWEETVEKANASRGENPPDGTYIMQLAGAELCEAKKTGNLQIKWTMTILEGDLAGNNKYDYMGLQGSRGLEPLSWRLGQLGIRLEDVDINKLEEFLTELVSHGPVMKVILKTGKDSDFQGVKIDKVLPGYDVDSAGYNSSDDNDNYTSTESDTSTEPEGDVEHVDLMPGMKVKCLVDGSTTEAVVMATDEAEGSVTVKVGKKEHKISGDDIQEVIEED
jgi:hypothetical protein